MWNTIIKLNQRQRGDVGESQYLTPVGAHNPTICLPTLLYSLWNMLIRENCVMVGLTFYFRSAVSI